MPTVLRRPRGLSPPLLRDRREAASEGLTYQAWCERRDRARAYDEAIEREEAEDRV